MIYRVPTLPVLMLAIFGLWGLLASYVTFDRDFARFEGVQWTVPPD